MALLGVLGVESLGGLLVGELAAALEVAVVARPADHDAGTSAGSTTVSQS